MKKKKVVFAVELLAILSISLLCWLAYRDPYGRERENLARELGVNIDDYPPAHVFPINYFREVLKPGMSSDEVHQIVKGYEVVFLCYNNVEFYYYFSTDDDKAVRYLIGYDKTGELEYTSAEDENSRYLGQSVSDCVPGRLGE